MRESDYLDDQPSFIERLKKIEAFATLSNEMLLELLSLTKIRSYDPGETIIKQGYLDSWVYILINGEVGVTRDNNTLFVMRRGGDIFGEMGVIDASPRSASIVALKPCLCLAMDASVVERMTGGRRDALHAVLFRLFSEVLAQRLRHTNEELVHAKEENLRLKEDQMAMKGRRIL